jgi:hypothetical protein
MLQNSCEGIRKSFFMSLGLDTLINKQFPTSVGMLAKYLICGAVFMQLSTPNHSFEWLICFNYNKEKLTVKNINEIKKRIGENLFKIRRERGLSLESASVLMGIKKSKLDWLERGSGCMNLSKLIKLANFYKIPIKDLFR